MLRMLQSSIGSPAMSVPSEVLEVSFVPLPHFGASLLFMYEASLSHNEAAYAATLCSLDFVPVVRQLPKCRDYPMRFIEPL